MAPLDESGKMRSRAHLATTRWSLVLSAAQAPSPESDGALATLCKAYWYPLYAYIRRRGYPPEDASDLTQAFFGRLLEKRFLVQADPTKGRFRSFLLASLKHFLANEWDKTHALKRGGGNRPISIDADAAEGSYRLEPAHEVTAEKIYERRWALTLLEQVLQRLRAEYIRSGKGNLFEALKPALTEPDQAGAYREIGVRLSMGEGAVKVAVHRLRKRYRALLLDEISQTVGSPAEVDEELQTLMAALN